MPLSCVDRCLLLFYILYFTFFLSFLRYCWIQSNSLRSDSIYGMVSFICDLWYISCGENRMSADGSLLLTPVRGLVCVVFVLLSLPLDLTITIPRLGTWVRIKHHPCSVEQAWMVKMDSLIFQTALVWFLKSGAQQILLSFEYSKERLTGSLTIAVALTIL